MTNIPVEAAIQFEHYMVNSLELSSNDLISFGSEKDLKLSLSTKVALNENNDKAQVTLACDISSSEPTPAFTLSITMVGYFGLQACVTSQEVQELYTKNMVAILFPYMRAVITTVTAAANIPSVVLPTINVAETLVKAENLAAKTHEPPCEP